MTARELAVELTGGKCLVEESEEALVYGGAVFNPNLKTIFLAVPEDDSGPSLGMAAHEAFHFLRQQRGVKLYQKDCDDWTYRDRCKEEHAVIKETLAWIEQSNLDPEKKRLAIRMQKISRFSYTPWCPLLNCLLLLAAKVVGLERVMRLREPLQKILWS
jgi:hypothetical protein